MHRSYLRIVRSLSESSWGREFNNDEEADRSLLDDPQKLAAFATLELVRGLMNFADSIREPQRPRSSNQLLKHEEATPFPDAAIGDRMYQYDLDCGLSEHVVVGKDDDGYVEIVEVGPPREQRKRSRYAGKYDHCTVEAAMREEHAYRQSDYNRKLRDREVKLAAALENGGDLSVFFASLEAEDEE